MIFIPVDGAVYRQRVFFLVLVVREEETTVRQTPQSISITSAELQCV